MATIPKGDFDNSYQIVLPDGQRLMFGRASVKLLETFPATRSLGRMARLLHLSWIPGGVYRFISWLRPHLGRFVKDAPGPNRWP